MTLGIWILGVFFLPGRYLPAQLLAMSRSRLMAWFDGISLYVYMTHSVFITSALSPYQNTDSLLVSAVLFFLLSFTSAMLLRWISGVIQRKFLKMA